METSRGLMVANVPQGSICNAYTTIDTWISNGTSFRGLLGKFLNDEAVKNYFFQVLWITTNGFKIEIGLCYIHSTEFQSFWPSQNIWILEIWDIFLIDNQKYKEDSDTVAVAWTA